MSISCQRGRDGCRQGKETERIGGDASVHCPRKPEEPGREKVSEAEEGRGAGPCGGPAVPAGGTQETVS